MSNLSTYYSFNVPDVNLNNQIVNWATGSPIYDASLNGAAYISRINYKRGNGSLEMPKNSITQVGGANTSITLPYTTGVDAAFFCITDDQLTIISCSYGESGSVQYKTRNSITDNFSSFNWSKTNTDETYTSKYFYQVSVTSDGNKFALCIQGGYVYFATRVVSGTGGYSALTQTLDIKSRVYQGLAMTKDGNRIVVAAADGIYFADWNNTNYNEFTKTLETHPNQNFFGIGISSNGDRIAYGQLISGQNRNWFLSFWNGSNYNKGSIFITSDTNTNPSGFYFNNDASILFLSYISATNQKYGIYNKNSNSYDTFTDINNTLIPYNARSIQCIDLSSNMRIYASAGISAIYYVDISYNTTTANNYCIIKSPNITTNGVTIACWFRSNYNLNAARIFDFATANTATSDNIRLLINNNALKFEIYKSSTNNSFNITSVNINDNSWIHIAITMSYSASTTSTIKFYINGSITTDTNINKPYPTVSSTANRVYSYLGKYNTTGDPQFFGNIDDFRIYNAVLSATEISSLYTDTNVKNNYRRSTIYLLYTTPVESVSTPITPNTTLTNVGSSKTYYYWNDPYAITNTIINKSNPYNFYYTYNNNNPYITNTNQISSLIADFDANVNVTSTSNKVSKWVSVNNSSIDASQTDSNIQPSITQNYINSYPAIDFGSVSNSLLVTNISDTTTTQELTLFFVMRFNATPTNANYYQFCSKKGTFEISGAIQLRIDTSNKLQIAVNSVGSDLGVDWTSSLIITSNTSFILTINISSVTGSCVSSYRYNGIANTDTHTHANNIVNLFTDFELGGWGLDPNRTFRGGIGEFIQYNKTLSLSEMQQVENYLGLKWGITSLYPSAKVSIITNDVVTLVLNGSIQQNLLNSVSTYSSPVTVPLVNGNNLFEFLTYNNGGPAYFAAYVSDSKNNYLFSTISEKTGWNIENTGLFSNGYPVSSLIVGNSLSTEYTNATAITTPTNYKTFNLDLSSNKSCKQIKLLDMNLKSNNNDLANIFLSYP